MTLSGCGLTPNPQLNFTLATRLVMDITIGHTCTAAHHFKPHSLQTMESTKRRKYSQRYTRQGLAFAPTVANTLGQFGPDLIQFLWNLANRHAQLTCGFNTETAVNISHEQAMDSRELRGLKHHENLLRLLTCLCKGVTTRVLGATFTLTC